VFLPDIMRPLPTPARLFSPGVRRIAQAPVSVVRGPPGTYVAEWLAGAIQAWARWQDCVWLRAPGARPEALAGSLASACLHRWADGGAQEWRSGVAADTRLDELMRRSPPGAVIVLELGDRATSGLVRLVRRIHPIACDRDINLVAVASRRLPGGDRQRLRLRRVGDGAAGPGDAGQRGGAPQRLSQAAAGTRRTLR
jgi:hypothetical protein